MAMVTSKVTTTRVCRSRPFTILTLNPNLKGKIQKDLRNLQYFYNSMLTVFCLSVGVGFFPKPKILAASHLIQKYFHINDYIHT